MAKDYKFSADLIKAIRHKFVNVDEDSFSGKRIYFENAGGTLKLKSLFEVIELYTGLPDNGGRRNPASREVDKVIAKGRSDIALLLGAKSGKIITEQSATGMIFRILSTITLNTRKGNIVTTNLDHASSYDATHILAKRYNMESRVTKLDPKTGAVPLKSILKEIDKDTAALIIIHASNILGSKNNVVAIVKEVRKVNPDIYVILDGAQHASHGKIDVEEYGSDAYIFVPYKIYSKAGNSFAHVTDRLANLPHDNLAGKPKDYWDLGTREEASYACMSKVVEYMQWLGSNFTDSQDARTKIIEGMLAIEEYELSLLKVLFHGTDQVKGMLSLENVSIYGEKENLKTREAIVAFNIKNKETENIVDYFEANGVRLHNRVSDAYSKHTLSGAGIEECVRVSLCHYNTIDEVNVFLKLLNNYVK